jgi:zinc D-Ala-D-Ala carboxypeptidase
MMNEYFTLRELLQSNTAKRCNIDNTPSFEVVANLRRLCTDVLNPSRVKYGNPIFVTSGYRCPELNARVGGVKNSQHQLGLAADLVCSNLPLLFEIIKSNGNVDQLLFEHNIKSRWLHVSIAPVGRFPRGIIIDNYNA